MKIVITGALGHIGSRLIRSLPAEFPDIEIVLLDNLLTHRYCSLLDLPSSGRYQFFEGDARTFDFSELFEGADAVIHLAAITNAPDSFENRELVHQVNFGGTQRVAEACIAAHAPMVFLSTTSVYGPQGEVVDEDCPESDLRPQSPYAASKLKAEHLLAQLSAEKGLRHTTFRFGTVFGTSIGMRFHTAINKFCWEAANGNPLPVWRTALDQKRPYLDLTDAVDAIILILRKQLFDGRTYNVLTLNATIRDIVQIIRSRLPSTEIDFVDTEIMNQLSYNVSAARFESEGFEPTGDLARGITETLEALGGLTRSTSEKSLLALGKPR